MKFEAASAHHKFSKSNVATRYVYKQICRDSRHSVQYQLDENISNIDGGYLKSNVDASLFGVTPRKNLHLFDNASQEF